MGHFLTRLFLKCSCWIKNMDGIPLIYILMWTYMGLMLLFNSAMLALVVVVFATCWLPFHVFQLASDLDLVLRFKEYKLIYTLFHIVAMCSTFTNPVLYGWMNKNYRNGFLMVFRCTDKPESFHTEGSFRTRSLRRLTMSGRHCAHHPTPV